MEGEEGGGFKLGKKSTVSTDKGGGEVDYRTKSGTAWSHNFLNQKPWHPLSYPNQRRKWIAEQTHAHKERRSEEVAREYAQEQEFFRQTALISRKEKEKLEMMKAVSFMYVKPPGYNAESAKAAEAADEQKTEEQEKDMYESHEPSQCSHDGASASKEMETGPPAVEKKKSRKKDIYGRALPTEEEFEVLKNAPRLETGLVARAKPFGIEIRNVKCLRCGKYGHQSGDRECPLKDTIMPNEENRIKRDDPLTTILAQTESAEPLKWELKQKPGMSPPRGGFKADDPNQQIVAEDIIFDEYGGFLGEANIPELLTNFSSSKSKKKSNKNKHRKRSIPACSVLSEQDIETSSDDDKRKREKKKNKRKKRKYSESSSSQSSDDAKHRKKTNRHKQCHSNSSEGSDFDEPRRRKNNHHHHRHHRDHHDHHRNR